MSRIIYLLVFTVFSISVTFAQPGAVPVTEKNGKQFYVHKVEKGQTAYAISKLYKTTVTVIFENNPSAEQGLNIGEELYIPTGKSVEVKEPVNPVINTNTQNNTTNNTGEGLQKEVIKGDTNKIIHTVTAGETMYALAKKYGVKLEDLQAANTGKVNLNLGDKIVIPIDKANKNNVIEPLVKNPVNTSVGINDSVILHTLEAGQTFYYLTKLYEVTELEIKAANDGLPEGLKKGDVIKIIVPKKHSVSEINKIIPAIFDSTSRVKEVYNVAIMLPYMLNENDKFRAKCPPVGDCPFYGYTMMSLNFERGVMMAIDSLKLAGLNVNVYVYDTEQDTATLSAILRKPEMKKMDLIFGPLYPKQIKLVADFARSNSIQNIVPVPVSNKALYNNPYVSKYVASTPTQIQYMGKYIATNYADANVIAIKNSANKQDGYNFDEFVKSFNANIKMQPLRTRDSVLTTSMNAASKLTSVESKLSATKKNIIVVPSEEVGHVSNFITKLAASTNKSPYSKYEFIVFGLEDFLSFETIDEKYKNRFNLHIVAPTYVDFASPEVNHFILTHRLKYGTDPDKYTFNGFDAAFTNLKGLMLYGVGFPLNYSSLENKGFASGSNYKTVESGSGYENQSILILEYNDYSVKIVNR